MNSAPHTHDLSVRDFDSSVHVKYGDTTTVIFKRSNKVSDRRLRRAIRRAIRQHDRGSIAAGRTANTIAKVVAEETARRRRWEGV